MGQALDGYVYTVSGNSSSRPSILLHVHPMPATTAVPAGTTVVVHPLVLLSAVDHYNRAARNTRKRVVGVLLGQVKGKSVNVANSFADRPLSLTWWPFASRVLASAFRGRREGSFCLVLGSQLCRGNERHVQENSRILLCVEVQTESLSIAIT
ncbi:hypothetical protein BC938DRAFT_479591 [Jimgerdemannia flammicorona]|uniref:JAB1/MPN/MOV34 metalloenzyme domain-containing protein n=1 Tax=Jimgerdemannia flammicorona TaxID=994334 RepID=A0A433QKI4_9FUNG|nr:hypothetical protein BC938DRAFT_479591 [Jimgerdemannia flammicorona]